MPRPTIHWDVLHQCIYPLSHYIGHRVLRHKKSVKRNNKKDVCLKFRIHSFLCIRYYVLGFFFFVLYHDAVFSPWLLSTLTEVSFKRSNKFFDIRIETTVKDERKIKAKINKQFDFNERDFFLLCLCSALL